MRQSTEWEECRIKWKLVLIQDRLRASRSLKSKLFTLNCETKWTIINAGWLRWTMVSVGWSTLIGSKKIFVNYQTILSFLCLVPPPSALQTFWTLPFPSSAITELSPIKLSSIICNCGQQVMSHCFTITAICWNRIVAFISCSRLLRI